MCASCGAAGVECADSVAAMPHNSLRSWADAGNAELMDMRNMGEVAGACYAVIARDLAQVLALGWAL